MTVARRLLVVVAHPDDETFGCGSLLAHAAARGIDITVACATRGELGEPAPGSGIEQSQLGTVREGELHAAAEELGVEHVVLFDWRDSGVDGEPAAESLAAAAVDDVAAAVVRLIDEVQPDVVVSIDTTDGHRDHAAIGKATVRAVERTRSRPARTYLWCVPRSLMTQFTGVPTFGVADTDITTVVDTSGYLEQRWRAIRKHVSQVPPFDAMSPELQREFLTADHLVRVDPPWTGGPIETDPFAELISAQRLRMTRRRPAAVSRRSSCRVPLRS